MQCKMLGATATTSQHGSMHGHPVVEPRVTRACHRPCLMVCSRVHDTREVCW